MTERYVDANLDMSIPKIQIAFQGGGAKLVAMLPIAHAFAQAQSDGFIKIHAVSGTSAGSICASLIATEANFDQVRQFISNNGPNLILNLMPKYIRNIRDDLNNGRGISQLQLLWHWKKFWAVLIEGAPALNSTAIQSFIEGILKSGTGKEVHFIEDLNVGLLIISSNIIESKSVDHRKGFLISAIMDSCSLPVLLRSFVNLGETHNVDGGLCDNLPVDGLVGENYPVFAVFPRSSTKKPLLQSAVSYLLALFSASINHSISRSRAKVYEDFCFETETDIGFIDFEQAVRKIADDNWYEQEKNKAYRRIRDFADSYGFISDPHEVRVTDIVQTKDYIDTLDRVTKSNNDFTIIKAVFCIRIKCDRRYRSSSDVVNRRSDTIMRVTHLQIDSDSFSFYRSHAATHKNSLVPCLFKAKNLTRNRMLPIRVLPLEEKKMTRSNYKECLIHFLDKEKHISKGDQIEVTSIYTAPSVSDMKKINFGMPDDFGLTNAQDEAIQKGELLLIYPRSLGKMELSNYKSKSTIALQPIDKIDSSFVPSALLGRDNEVAGMSFSNLGKGDRAYILVSPV